MIRIVWNDKNRGLLCGPMTHWQSAGFKALYFSVSLRYEPIRAHLNSMRFKIFDSNSSFLDFLVKLIFVEKPLQYVDPHKCSLIYWYSFPWFLLITLLKVSHLTEFHQLYRIHLNRFLLMFFWWIFLDVQSVFVINFGFLMYHIIHRRLPLYVFLSFHLVNNL